jgi:rubrerythrin
MRFLGSKVKIPIIVKSTSGLTALLKSDLGLEQESIDGYEATLKLAPDKFKDVLTEILNDEKDHAAKINKILEEL